MHGYCTRNIDPKGYLCRPIILLFRGCRLTRLMQPMGQLHSLEGPTDTCCRPTTQVQSWPLTMIICPFMQESSDDPASQRRIRVFYFLTLYSKNVRLQLCMAVYLHCFFALPISSSNCLKCARRPAGNCFCELT